MKKNGFTLIELLAIIVILAIIAVITVPIILGIIDDAQMNAAKDSAYGYKDSVSKYYAQQLLSNQNLKLNDTYTVTNGTLSGGSFGDSNVTSLPIQVSGTVPTSGTLTYSNNVLTSGCLAIGDYAVTFNTNGEVSSTLKGDCSNSSSQTNEPQVDNSDSTELTMATMCPDCVFAFTTNTWYYSGTPTTLTSNQYKENYEDVVSESGYDSFLGIKLNSSGTIEKAYACGIEGTTPFCLEGTTDGSKYSDNVDILNTIFTDCDADVSLNSSLCIDSLISADAFSTGLVGTNYNRNKCYVENDGKLYCLSR